MRDRESQPRLDLFLLFLSQDERMRKKERKREREGRKEKREETGEWRESERGF